MFVDLIAGLTGRTAQEPGIPFLGHLLPGSDGVYILGRVAEVVADLFAWHSGVHGNIAKDNQKGHFFGVGGLHMGIDPVGKQTVTLRRVATAALAVDAAQKLLQVKAAGEGGHLQRPAVITGIANGGEADFYGTILREVLNKSGRRSKISAGQDAMEPVTSTATMMGFLDSERIRFWGSMMFSCGWLFHRRPAGRRLLPF